MKQKWFNETVTCRFKYLTGKSYSAFNSLSRVVSIGVIVGSTLAAVPVVSASAQSGEKDMEPKLLEKELEEVIVSASLLEMPLAQTTKAITIITRADIERAPVQSIEDLLTYVASVDVVQRGQHGVQADISIRGGTSDQIAVLLNGINLTNSQTGHYNFDIPINISDIERIEILHGPAALVYGVSSFSGGVNIITNKQADKRLHISTEAGMHQLRNMEARGATKLGATINTLSVGYKASDGYIENSDYDIYNILWQTRWQLKQANKIDLQLGYNEKQYGANTFYSAKYPNQYERTSTYMGTVKGEFGTKLKIKPSLYWNRHHDQFDLIKDTATGRNFHRNELYGASVLLSYLSQLGNTSLANELRREEVMSTKLGKPMGKPHRRYTKYDRHTHSSIGLEHTVSVEQFILSAGMLVNHNTMERSKYNFLPSASISYAPATAVKLFTSWSKSTRLPTFTDLYYTTETHIADQTLKSERSQSWELGANYGTSFFSAYATGFLLWGRNIIDWVKTDTEQKKWSSWNHSQLDNKGIEVGVKLNTGKLLPVLGEQSLLKIDYTQMHQKYNSQELLSLYSQNYLKRKLTTQFNHAVYKGFSANWHFRFQQRAGMYERFENLESVGFERFPTFTTLDLRLNYVFEHLKINLDLKNLYNTHYFDLGNIPQARFWLMGGISYSL